MKEIPQYASGTSSAKGGLSIVGEKGAELRVLNSGDGIIPADITANLMSIGKNPSQYFKVDYEKIFSLLSSSSMMENTLNRMFGEDIRLTMPSSENYNQTIAPAINITIQGDATQSTVDALKAEANKIIRKATDNIMNIALKNKRII